jgi:hypothetical protein
VTDRVRRHVRVEGVVQGVGFRPFVYGLAGRRSSVVVDSVRFCFDLVTEDTSLAGAELVVDEPPGRDLRIVSVEVIRECAAPAAAPKTTQPPAFG